MTFEADDLRGLDMKVWDAWATKRLRRLQCLCGQPGGRKCIPTMSNLDTTCVKGFKGRQEDDGCLYEKGD